ncbi:MAG: hypothetical protein AAF192_10560 [Pseudomonadota bacterium]
MIIEDLGAIAIANGTFQRLETPSAAVLDNGDVAIGWLFEDTFGSTVVRAQRFDPLLRADGAVIDVASGSVEIIAYDVVALDDGAFASTFANSADGQVVAATFDGRNDAAGSAVIVTSSPDFAFISNVSVVRQGDDFVAIHSRDTAGSNAEPFLHSARTPVDFSSAASAPLRLFANDEVQTAPDAAVLANGNVAYAYQEVLSGFGDNNIFLGALTPQDTFDPPRESTTEAVSEDVQPHIAALTGGGFVVVYQAGTQILMRLHDEDARGLRDVQAPINLQAGDQAFDVTALPDGGYVIAFATANVDQSTTSDQIRVRRFDANGDNVGSGFTLALLDNASASTVAGLNAETTEDGRVLITWGDRLNGDAVLNARILDFRTGEIRGDGDANVLVGVLDAANEMFGLGGADVIFGRAGADDLRGGGAADLLSGRAGADMLLGQAGNDEIRGGGGADVAKGGAGADTVVGGRGRDDLDGGGAGDVIEGGRGVDALAGGGGRDSFMFSQGDRRDTISDFKDRRDKLVFESGAERFADLDIRQKGDDVVVSYGDRKDAIILENFEADDLTARDVMFV